MKVAKIYRKVQKNTLIPIKNLASKMEKLRKNAENESNFSFTKPIIKCLHLIFFEKCGLIFTRVAKALNLQVHNNVDDGHRRSAKGRAEGISSAACRRDAKISGKRTVT